MAVVDRMGGGTRTPLRGSTALGGGTNPTVRKAPVAKAPVAPLRSAPEPVRVPVDARNYAQPAPVGAFAPKAAIQSMGRPLPMPAELANRAATPQFPLQQGTPGPSWFGNVTPGLLPSMPAPILDLNRGLAVAPSVVDRSVSGLTAPMGAFTPETARRESLIRALRGY